MLGHPGKSTQSGERHSAVAAAAGNSPTGVAVRSGNADQFGAGQYRLVPTLGYRYALPEVSPGSFFVGAVRYDFDFAGSSTRKHIRNLQFSPTFNIGLPDQMFLTFFPSTDIRYDFVAKSWFVPFDIQIGKLWGKSVVTSLELAVPMYRGSAPLYNFKAEARQQLARIQNQGSSARDLELMASAIATTRRAITR